MTALYLRTVDASHKAYAGFQWPDTVGAEVVAPDWSPAPVCGNGLHGLMWGEGDASLLSTRGDAVWQVVAASTSVDLGGKHKFERCVLVYTGTRDGAVGYIAANGGAGRACAFGTATAGEGGTATAGDWGTATAGDGGVATAGDGGTATAGEGGTATAGDGGTATAGEGGTATAGEGGTATAGARGTATAGARGTATAGARGTATAGYLGTATAGYMGTATAGEGGTATAGEWGIVCVAWYDGRRRLVVGYVGEDGIRAGVAYEVRGGKLGERAR